MLVARALVAFGTPVFYLSIKYREPKLSAHEESKKKRKDRSFGYKMNKKK